MDKNKWQDELNHAEERRKKEIENYKKFIPELQSECERIISKSEDQATDDFFLEDECFPYSEEDLFYQIQKDERS